jgi:hypothetical protein
LNAARQAAAKAQAVTGTIHGLETAANVGMVARGLEHAATAEHGDEALGGGAQAALGAMALRMAHRAGAGGSDAAHGRITPPYRASAARFRRHS